MLQLMLQLGFTAKMWDATFGAALGYALLQAVPSMLGKRVSVSVCMTCKFHIILPQKRNTQRNIPHGTKTTFERCKIFSLTELPDGAANCKDWDNSPKHSGESSLSLARTFRPNSVCTQAMWQAIRRSQQGTIFCCHRLPHRHQCQIYEILMRLYADVGGVVAGIPVRMPRRT
eukprot:6333845-Amphidinium_carterae.1